MENRAAEPWVCLFWQLVAIQIQFVCVCVCGGGGVCVMDSYLDCKSKSRSWWSNSSKSESVILEYSKEMNPPLQTKSSFSHFISNSEQWISKSVFQGWSCNSKILSLPWPWSKVFSLFSVKLTDPYFCIFKPQVFKVWAREPSPQTKRSRFTRPWFTTRFTQFSGCLWDPYYCLYCLLTLGGNRRNNRILRNLLSAWSVSLTKSVTSPPPQLNTCLKMKEKTTAFNHSFHLLFSTLN